MTGATDREQPRLLRGGRVMLEPLTRAHAEALFPSASDPEVWRWKLVPRPDTLLEMEALITEVMVGPGRWPFVISTADGQVVGSTTLARFDWTHRVAEMGFTWLAPDRWGQGFNEEAKLVLLRHCFEDAGLVRIEFQVDEDNRRSVSALHRLGFTYEGRLRSRHLRPDGTRRNSLYFSVLAEEWPRTAARLTDLIHQRTASAPARNGEDPLIRSSLRTDAAPIAVLLNDLGYPRSLEQIDHERTAYGTTVLVAEVDHQVVGVLAMHLRRHFQHATLIASIDALVVSEAHRGTGVGAALLNVAIDQARTYGATVADLNSDIARVDARRFYERAGFEVVSNHFRLPL